jgi:hypothetical protein
MRTQAAARWQVGSHGRFSLACSASLPHWQLDAGHLHLHLSFAKSLCPKLKGVLPVWRKRFGLGARKDRV